MFLLFGCVLLLLSAPLSMMCSGIFIIKSPGKFKRYLVFYIFAAFILAYSCMPNYENDLIRYFDMINACKDVTFNNAFTWAEDGLVVKNFIFWLINRCGDVHLLPAIAAAIFYGVAAYIASDQVEVNTKHLGTIITFQLLTIPFLESISNVRNVAAFSLIILAAYRDIVKKKRNIGTFLLYTLPCFIHMTGFVMLLARAAVPLFKKYPIICNICAIGIPGLTLWSYGNFFPLIQGISGNIGVIMSRALNKSYTATMAISQYAQTMQESGYFNACRVINMVIIICLIILTLKYISIMRQEHQKEKSNYASFVLIICDIAAVWCAMKIIKYWVFMFAAIVACSPILMYYMIQFKSTKRWMRICVYGIQLSAVLRFGLEIYYIKSRVLILDLFEGILFNNAFSILWNLVHI